MHHLLLTFSLLVATASLGVAIPHKWSVLDYLIQLAADECTQAGQTICSQDCNTVIRCVSNGQGGFDRVELATCTAGTTRCSAEEGRCVEGSTACGGSTGGPIDCHGTGYFPDPYNCTVYHICLSATGNSVPHSCSNGYAYNPLTTQCSYRTTDSVCTEGPVPACVSVGQSGPLATNPSIYYTCTSDGNTLIPELYRCPNGEVYDPTSYSCIDSTATTGSTGSGGSSEPTTTPSSDSTTPPPTTGGDCWPRDLSVADPADCTHYYVCGPNYRWEHAACPILQYYNPVHNHCEIGFC